MPRKTCNKYTKQHRLNNTGHTAHDDGTDTYSKDYIVKKRVKRIIKVINRNRDETIWRSDWLFKHHVDSFVDT